MHLVAPAVIPICSEPIGTFKMRPRFHSPHTVATYVQWLNTRFTRLHPGCGKQQQGERGYGGGAQRVGAGGGGAQRVERAEAGLREGGGAQL